MLSSSGNGMTIANGSFVLIIFYFKHILCAKSCTLFTYTVYAIAYFWF